MSVAVTGSNPWASGALGPLLLAYSKFTGNKEGIKIANSIKAIRL
jgi:hypothetical protein